MRQIADIDHDLEGVKPRDRFVLYILLNSGDMTTMELAQHSGCSQNQIRQIISRLKREDLIETAPNPVEPRSNLYQPAV